MNKRSIRSASEPLAPSIAGNEAKKDEQELDDAIANVFISLDKAMSDGSSFSEVSKILSDRIEDTTQYYLIKWKDYPLNQSTWEPESHLINCRAALAFH